MLGVSVPTAGAHGSGHTEPAGTSTHTDFPARWLARAGRGTVARVAASGRLEAAWCGAAGGVGAGGSAPSISVVYAVPSDQPNRFRQAAGMLQLGAGEIGRFIASESGHKKTIRFETGTSCGSNYLRIELVRLSQPRMSYLDSSGAPAIAAVRGELERVLPASTGPRNWLVYVDGLVDRASGWGQIVDADAPGSANPHNAGGLFAFVWGARRAPSKLQVPSIAYLMLHEVTHNLGGVQRSASHSSGAWHCTDGSDVMCYDDGGPASRQQIACRRATTFGGAYDCNQDDYFNPSPAPGSYLATHWNVYDSAFLGTCRELRAACGGAAASRRASRAALPGWQVR